MSFIANGPIVNSVSRAKLTFICYDVFQDIFGGNCLTSVFALLHPHGNDNSKSLKVSQTIRNIKQNVSINMVSVCTSL